MNPIYDYRATTPPGLAAIPSMVGGMIAPYVGGYARPYVPENQSTFGAIMAKNVNDPMYKTMMARTYGQLFSQAMGTAGSLPIVQSFGRMVGYSPEQIQRDLSAMSGDFGRSTLGSLIAPLTDQWLNTAGLSGGSFIDVANNAFNNRFNLMSPGIMINPLDMQMQRQAMGGAAAMSQLINGLSSKWDSESGTALLAPNMQFTRGLDRSTVSNVVMRMAGAGAFNGSVNGETRGLMDQIQDAIGSRDLASLDWSKGDFIGGKDGEDGDKKLAEITKRFARQAQGGIRAVGAMRDLLNEVDGAIEKLDALTNGKWAQSGADGYAAEHAVRKLHAVTQMYNLDPNKTVDQLLVNKGALQDAAGFGGAMRYMGFDGGGLFGLEAQTALLANTEDMISRRGIRGDPVKAERARKQALQAYAQTMNTRGGVAAQLLAWGRQTGVVSDEAAAGFATELASGDRAVMGDSLNRLLTLEFGSAERGQKLMNDATFIQTMRQSLTDKSGAYANNLMTLGADREFSRRELITAAENRYAASTDALQNAGMSTVQSDEDLATAVRDMADNLRNDKKLGEGGKNVADFITSTYKNHIAKGEDANSAFQQVLSSLQNDPTLAKYYEQAKMTAENSLSTLNENRIEKGGLPSLTAKLLTESMERGGAITAEQSSKVYELLGDNKYADALKMAEGYLEKTDPAERKIYEQARGEAERQYKRQQESTAASRDAGDMLKVARAGGFGASEVVDTLTTVADAARSYRGEEDDEKFYDLVQKSGFSEKFGYDMYKQLLEARKGGVESLHKFGSRMGRAIAPLQELAVKNLQENGHGAEMWGYWGGGMYAGNNAAARKQRDDLMEGLKKAMGESSDEDADLYQSVANDAVDFFTGHKNWKELLGVYDPTGKAGSAFRKYGEAFDTYNSKYEEFQKHQSGLKNIIKSLEDRGTDNGYLAAEMLRKMIEDGNMDKNAVDDFIKRGDITDDEQKKTLYAVADAQQEMIKARKASEDVLTETFKDKGAVDTMKAIGKREAYEKQKIQAYGSEKYSGVGEFVAEMSAKDLSKLIQKSGADISDLVDNDAIARHLGVSADNVSLASGEDYQRALAKSIQEKATSGDKAAMAFMDKAKAAANAEKNKIHGELIIKDGNESRAAVLEASIGGGLS